MKSYIIERARMEGAYIVASKSTVRATGEKYGISKSTVHKDVTERLKVVDEALYEQVKAILEKNLSERHLRGGNATKMKYEKEKHTL